MKQSKRDKLTAQELAALVQNITSNGYNVHGIEASQMSVYGEEAVVFFTVKISKYLAVENEDQSQKQAATS